MWKCRGQKIANQDELAEAPEIFRGITVEVRAEIIALLVNPDGVYQDTMKLKDIENPAELLQAPYAVLGMIVSQGGLARKISEDEVQFIPIQRVKDISVKICKVVLANAGNMPKAGPRLVIEK